MSTTPQYGATHGSSSTTIANLNLAAARLNLSERMAYFSHVLWAMIPIPVKDLAKKAGGPIAVDKYWRLYFDPERIEHFTVFEVEGCLYHEINHLVRDHCLRAEGLNADPYIWNLAADCEINDDVERDAQMVRDDRGNTFVLPEGCVYPKKWSMPEERLSEEYYEELLKQIPKYSVDIHWELEDGKGGSMGPQIQRGKVHGTCGSAAGGNQTNDWELGEPTRQDPGMAEHEADLIRRRVAEDIMNHASRTRGTVPGHWERWAKSLLKPKVNWRQEIRNQINHAVAMVRGMSDFTFRHPSRRQAFMGNKIRLPGMYQPIPDVLFIIDTSGSMSDTYLAQCVTEVGAAIRALGNSIAFRVIAADAAAYGIQRVFKAEQIRLHGGGGTDMRVPIELAQQQKPKPDIIVVLSDGFTPWPEEKPSKHFIIILTGEKGSFPETPAYAKTIKVDTSDAKEDFKRR